MDVKLNETEEPVEDEERQPVDEAAEETVIVEGSDDKQALFKKIAYFIVAGIVIFLTILLAIILVRFKHEVKAKGDIIKPAAKAKEIDVTQEDAKPVDLNRLAKQRAAE